MAPFQAKYSEDQRETVRRAGLDLGIAPKDIARMAGRGELKLRGVPMAPFQIPVGSVYGLIREERKRREGKELSNLVNKPHLDAVEVLRQRMISLGDTETLRMEKAQKAKPSAPIDAEHARKMARFLRELAAMPPPGRPGPQPGKWVPGEGKPAGEAEAAPNSMKGQLAAALERGLPGGEAAPGDPIPSDLRGGEEERNSSPETAGTTLLATQGDEDSGDDGDGGDPGSWARRQFDGVSATHVDGVRLDV